MDYHIDNPQLGFALKVYGHRITIQRLEGLVAVQSEGVASLSARLEMVIINFGDLILIHSKCQGEGLAHGTGTHPKTFSSF